MTQNQVLDTRPEPMTFEHKGQKFISNAVGIYDLGAIDSYSAPNHITLDVRNIEVSKEAAWDEAISLNRKYEHDVRVLTCGKDDPRIESAF